MLQAASHALCLLGNGLLSTDARSCADSLQNAPHVPTGRCHLQAQVRQTDWCAGVSAAGLESGRCLRSAVAV